MGRNKRKKKIPGRWFPVTNHMMNSLAWKTLSCAAVWVYLDLIKKFRGNNKDDLSLTYSEIKWKLKSSATVSKAFKQLIECGFFKVIRPGGLYRGCTIYGISDEWETYLGNNNVHVSGANHNDDPSPDLDPTIGGL
jgi:hypothetical protein